MRYSFYYNDELYVPVMVNGVEAFMETQYIFPLSINVNITKDGDPLVNTAITVDGQSYTTNSSGQITMTGDYGLIKKCYFYLSDNNYAYTNIEFTELATNVVDLTISGSLSFGHSDNNMLFDTFIIPAGINVIKFSGEVQWYWDINPDTGEEDLISTGDQGIARGSYDTWNSWRHAEHKFYLDVDNFDYPTFTFSYYLGVTSGETYTLHRCAPEYTLIEWSGAINQMPVNATI